MQPLHLTPAVLGLMLLVSPSWATDDTNTSNPAQSAEQKVRNALPEARNQAGDPANSQKAGSSDVQAMEETAIRETAKSYIAAFQKGDAEAIAAQFTSEGEFVGYDGATTRGRAEIEALYKKYFDAHRNSRIDISIESLRFLSPTVVIEDGTSILQQSNQSEPIQLPYTAVHIKDQGRWLVASVREHPQHHQRTHRTHLEQLNWLVGDWIHEGDNFSVHFDCRPNNGGNFLMRHFSIQSGGHHRASGLQMIGWDAQAQRFRAWIFDSDGGFAEGFWHQNNNEWLLELAGVTADGKSASSTSIYTPVDENTINFRTVNHQLNGVSLPDSDAVTIVRRAGRPDSSLGGQRNSESVRSAQPQN